MGSKGTGSRRTTGRAGKAGALLAVSLLAAAAGTPATGQAPEQHEEEQPPITDLGETPQVPAPEAGPTGRSCNTQDLMRGLCDDATRAEGEKPWRLIGQVILGTPVVQDPSPGNETFVLYYLGGEFDLPLRGFYLTGFIGLAQEFWRTRGRESLDWIDPVFGVGYRGTTDLGDRQLIMVHRLTAVYPPIARSSRENLLYTRLSWISAFRMSLVGDLMLGVNLGASYWFRRYAEQDADAIDNRYDGAGGSNSRASADLTVLLQQGIFDHPTAGNLMAQATAGYRHWLRYDGGGVPSWTWSLGLVYTPIPYLSLSVAMEQPSLGLNLGYSNVNRGGVLRVVGFDRDETYWNVTVIARY